MAPWSGNVEVFQQPVGSLVRVLVPLKALQCVWTCLWALLKVALRLRHHHTLG